MKYVVEAAIWDARAGVASWEPFSTFGRFEDASMCCRGLTSLIDRDEMKSGATRARIRRVDDSDAEL